MAGSCSIAFKITFPQFSGPALASRRIRIFNLPLVLIDTQVYIQLSTVHYNNESEKDYLEQLPVP